MRTLIRLTGRLILVLMAAAFATGAYVYLTLPDVRPLRTRDPGMTAFQQLRADEARRKGKEPRHVQRWVGYARISPHLKRAVLVAEDAKFWQHGGLDFEQIRESMEVNLERGEFVRGASTITQQLAKNLYLTPSKDPVRKARELLIARRLEAELSKRRILELYLNVVEWGDRIYGAEAAARAYFRKSAADLGPNESALLAAALVNPRLLDPERPSPRLRRRQQMIARRMGGVRPPPAVAATERHPPVKPLLPEPLDGVPALPEPITPGGRSNRAAEPGHEASVDGCDTPPCR